MATSPKKIKVLDTLETGSDQAEQPTEATDQTAIQQARLERLKYLEDEAIPKLETLKSSRISLASQWNQRQERLLMQGCIDNPNTDILSHMGPRAVLEGLRYHPEYMVQLERQHQYGDRCLHACIVVCKRSDSVLLRIDQILHNYAKLVVALGENTEQTSRVHDLNVTLESNAEDLVVADRALKHALKALEMENNRNPWGH